jgi:probable HAF family extracellular repeat protein
MKFKTSICVLAMIVFGPMAATIRLAAQELQNSKQFRYTVIDLGTLGGTFGESTGINKKGLVSGIGNLTGDQNQHVFLWVEGLKTDLGTLGGPNSGAFYGNNINSKGSVVGHAETSTPDPRGEDACFYGTHLICLPFLWQDGVMTPLPTLSGGNNGSAQGINNRGQAVGFSENGTPDATCPPGFVNFVEGRPVIWENGGVEELFPFPGDSDAVATAINDDGQAVGWSGNCTTLFHAVLWQNGTVTDLGNLGGTPQPGFMLINDAAAINNLGQVVGGSVLPGNPSEHAFLWRDGLMSDLGALPGDALSFAESINDNGQVVGQSCNTSGNCRAFVWQSGVMTDLNTLIPADSPWYLLDAPDIGSRGEIVGDALQKSTGEIHAILASPSEEERIDVEGDLPQGTLGQQREMSGSAKIALAEKVRRLLQQRRFGRFGRQLTGPQ